jgi:hypothetical protein
MTCETVNQEENCERSHAGRGQMPNGKSRIMKRNRLLPLGILSAGALVGCMTLHAQVHSQVYAQGVYSSGTTDYGVCSTVLPFAPYRYELTEISWREDTNGFLIMDIGRKPESGDISRRCLEVQSGSESFFMPMDSAHLKTPFTSIIGSGDLASVLTQCTANRGGRKTTHALPMLQSSWICGSRTNEEIFIFKDDHFVKIQNLLERAYGKSDGSIFSTNDAGGDCCSLNYAPAQIGVFLNLTRTWDDATIVSIIGNQKP